jgi:Sap, sulfolipid-1-addressing protein
MNNLFPGLVVLAIGGSIAPPLVFLTILFLGSRSPLTNASALALGYFAACAAIGVSTLVLFGGAEGAVFTAGRVISVTVGALLLALGLRSLLSVPEASPPRWLASINSISPPRAFAFGVALFPLQVKNLAIFVACLHLIIASGLDPQGSIGALGLVLLVFAVPVLAIIGLYAAAPGRAQAMLGSLQTWMVKHNRSITVAICFVFGAFFLLRGLLGA